MLWVRCRPGRVLRPTQHLRDAIVASTVIAVADSVRSLRYLDELAQPFAKYNLDSSKIAKHILRFRKRGRHGMHTGYLNC